MVWYRKQFFFQLSGLQNQFLRFIIFLSSLDNYEENIYLLWYHVKIWQVSPQHRRGVACHLWMWLNWTNKDINKSSNVPKRKIIEMILSKPYKWAKQQ